MMAGEGRSLFFRVGVDLARAVAAGTRRRTHALRVHMGDASASTRPRDPAVPMQMLGSHVESSLSCVARRRRTRLFIVSAAFSVSGSVATGDKHVARESRADTCFCARAGLG